MQDSYIGDIGDYGKYGLLREVCMADMSLSVNWYRVAFNKNWKQNDGKYINYLTKPKLYRNYDPFLFDMLYKIVIIEKDRKIESIEKENLFKAVYFHDEIGADRQSWHKKALNITQDAEVVFLDPDNGLETKNMYKCGTATSKHVKWTELKAYYTRGQNVILYQHRPQMTTKEKCIEDIMNFRRTYLSADCVKLLEFPKYTNRFYFMFLHEKYYSVFENVCNLMIKKWGNNDFCHEIILD